MNDEYDVDRDLQNTRAPSRERKKVRERVAKALISMKMECISTALI